MLNFHFMQKNNSDILNPFLYNPVHPDSTMLQNVSFCRDDTQMFIQFLKSFF